MADPRRRIPSADRLLRDESFAGLLTELPRELVLRVLRAELDRLREAASAGITDVSAATLASRVRGAAARLAGGTMRPVINATGVVLHTNLGRAPLADAALDAIHAAASGYCNLEYDVETGARGSRYVHCRDLLVDLTGAEDALVVNNNAAALVLALNTLAHDRDAVISRGELVEIGGAFRVPDIMVRSGARLREVGSTNRTHIADYRDAVSAHTGALLKVHPSNFTQDGYTAEVSVAELGEFSRQSAVPLIHDVGSGLLLEPAQLGLPPSEPVPAASLEHADVVTMSGDKLLGGPQCGIVLGRAPILERMRRNPLCRALRVDKLTLAALAATLRLYLQPERALREIPTLRMLTMSAASLEERARAFGNLCAAHGIVTECIPGESAVGGGASPGAVLPGTLVRIASPGTSAAGLERRLRTGDPVVVTRVLDGAVTMDLRTVHPREEAALLRALRTALLPGGTGEIPIDTTIAGG